MPALFTRISTRPCLAMAPETTNSTLAGSVTSRLTASALPPDNVIVEAVSSAFEPRAAATTMAPCDASVFATAAPIPRDAPVTMATFPERLIILSARLAPRRDHPARQRRRQQR